MPHVTFVPFTGSRIREEEMLALGMTLPGLQARASAIGSLPALGLLTLAGMLPEHWSCTYRAIRQWDETFVEQVIADGPDLVAVSALTACVEEACRFSRHLRSRGVRTVLGGLHATACPYEARQFCGAVVDDDGTAVWPRLLADLEIGRLRPIYRAPAGAGPAWPNGTKFVLTKSESLRT